MGSLMPGWNKKKSGAPKNMQDFEEPSKLSPRASLIRTSCDQPRGPPNLSRTSCPPSFHASVLPLQTDNHHQRHEEVSPVRIVFTKGAHQPQSPRPTSPRSPQLVGSAPSSAFARLLAQGGEEDLDEKMKWCDRFESAGLNTHPDEGNYEEEWRHGSFKLEDPVHCMHLHVEQQQQHAHGAGGGGGGGGAVGK